MTEIWKDIEGYNGLYKVSNLGRVKSFNQTSPKIVSAQKTRLGYITIKLYKNGESIRKSIHRLVAKEFIPNPENKPEVNHIDCDKSNNSVYNLEWATRSENMKHADINGLLSDKRGYKSPCSKFEENDVLQIMSLHFHGWFTQKQLADAYNVHVRTIQRLIYRNRNNYA